MPPPHAASPPPYSARCLSHRLRGLAAALWRDEQGSAAAEYLCLSAAGASAAASAAHVWGAKLARMFAQVTAALP